jgi:CBS domain-containing protein
MSRDVVCVRRDVRADDVVWLFLKHRISSVPVVDAENRPIGVVSKTDIIRAYATERLRSCATVDSFDVCAPTEPWPATAADVMSAPALTLSEREPRTRAAELLVARGVHRAPVVASSGGRVVGMISALDLLR